MGWKKENGKWVYRNPNGKKLSEAYMKKSAKGYADEMNITEKKSYNQLFGEKPKLSKTKVETAKKNKNKVEVVNFYKGNYGTYAENKKEADDRIDHLQSRTPKVNFTLPKRIKSKTVRITPKMRKLQ